VNRVKTWLALVVLILVSLSANILATTVTLQEGATVDQQNAPYQTQQSLNPVTIDSSLTAMTVQSPGDAGSVAYSLDVIEPEQAISEENNGVPVNGPSPTVLIPSNPQTSEGQEHPSAIFPHGYITIPWWLFEFLQENWWLLLLIVMLIVALYVYLKHKEEVRIEIEIPKWAT